MPGKHFLDKHPVVNHDQAIRYETVEKPLPGTEAGVAAAAHRTDMAPWLLLGVMLLTGYAVFTTLWCRTLAGEVEALWKAVHRLVRERIEG